MYTKSRFKNFTLLLLILFQTAFVFSQAQTANIVAPRREKLLNGMKLLVWNAPAAAAAAQATVKLRIHSGSAFDPKDKEGTMALLAESLFPTDAAKEFFTEELGGKLEVISNYDYIQITATANNEQLLTMLETLATAVINVQTDKETTDRVRAIHLEKVRELEKNPSYVADRAAAKRLFGDFPYGRPQPGTLESAAKIDFADLTLAKQRFLTADNATLAVVVGGGSAKPDLVYRAARRYFGAWTQSDKKIPATFRQPDAPDAGQFSIELPNVEKTLSRTAQIAAARNDNDFYAMQVLAKIRQNQFCLSDETSQGKLKFESYLLRGIYVIAQDKLYSEPDQILPSNRNPCSFLLVNKDGKTVYPSISQSDFDHAKSQMTAEYQQKIQSLSGLAEMWLDVDTFKLASVNDELTKLNNVRLADVRQTAENLQKQPTVSVIVKKTEPLKSN